MTHETQASELTTKRPSRTHIERVSDWLNGWGTYLRNAANEHIFNWHASLLSRRNFTHPDVVKRMREPVRPATRATWYR